MEIGYWPNTPTERLDKLYATHMAYGNDCEIYFNTKDFLELGSELSMKTDLRIAYFVFKKHPQRELKYKGQYLGVYCDRKARFSYVIKNGVKRNIVEPITV